METVLRRPWVMLGLGLLLGLAAGWFLTVPRYHFMTQGTFTTRGDLRTGEIVIYGYMDGKAERRALSEEADKNP